jgi:hypothetical protein
MAEIEFTRLRLRDLSVPARVVIAVFLISVGLGYFSALVQLHVQEASAGNVLPDANDAIAAYHGRRGVSQLERVLTADESKPFDGSGSMRPALTTRSARWKKTVEERAQEKNLKSKDGTPDLLAAEADVRAERESERLSLLTWIRAGADRQAFENDALSLPASLAGRAITEKYLEADVDGKKSGRVKIKSIVADRCERCHHEGGQASSFPLGTYEQVYEYCDGETNGGGMSLKKLAQSTHVHLLGFSMLYGLTGLIFALTSYPLWVRVILGPFTLLAQIVDISCWWLGRLDPLFAKCIVVTGGAVAMGLGLQIVLSLFNMFGRVGRIVLIVIAILVLGGAYVVKDRFIDPYLAHERMSTAIRE